MFDRCKVIVDTALHSCDELEMYDQIWFRRNRAADFKHLKYSEKIGVAERMARISIKLDQAALHSVLRNDTGHGEVEGDSIMAEVLPPEF